MELFTEDKLKELSKFVSSFKQLNHIAAEWNKIKTDGYYTVRDITKAINDSRNNTVMVMNRYFNRLMCMPERDWTNPETLMFYIYIDCVVQKHENAELALSDFTLYSGRSASKVIMKAFEYPILQPQFKGVTQHKLIAIVNSFIKDRNYSEAISYVDRVYDLNDDKVRECLLRQDSLFIPDVDDRNKPVIQPIQFGKQTGPFTTQDLLDKFNGNRITSTPPFKPPANVVPIEQPKPEETSKITPFNSPFATSIPTLPETPEQQKMDDFEYDIRELINTRGNIDKNPLHDMADDHPIFKLMDDLIHPMVDFESVLTKIMAHQSSIQSFILHNSGKVCDNKATNDLQFNVIRLFLIIAARAGITIRPLAKYLCVKENKLADYITRQRKAFSDFIRNASAKDDMTSVEVEFVNGYIKDVHETDGFTIIDSIYVAVQVFDLTATHLVPKLVNGGYLKSTTLSGRDLCNELNRILRWRTKKFRNNGFIEHDHIDVEFADHFAIANQFIPTTDSKFRSLSGIDKAYQTIEIPPLDIEEVEDVVEEVAEVTSSMPNSNIAVLHNDASWKRNTVEEFIEHSLVSNEGSRVSFEDMYRVFCNFCKTIKNIKDPLVIEEFNYFMIIINIKKTSDEFDNYFWVDWKPFNSNMVKTEEELHFEQMCRTMGTLFPNINVKQIIPIVSTLLKINERTDVNIMELKHGNVLTFDGLTRSIPAEIVHLEEQKELKQQ